MIDLDANATYAPSESLQELVRAALDKLGGFSRLGNPSSIHRNGQRAKAAIEEAREQVRSLVGARPKDLVIFTSGASEANNTVISSATASAAHIVSSAIEHPCILEPLKLAASRGVTVSLVSPDQNGEIAVKSVVAEVRSSTALVSIMAANNETGIVNDIKSIADATRTALPGALIHTDAAQMIGKMSLSFEDLGIDFATISGHKFGALTGVGALIIRAGSPVSPLILGGPQESKLRGGTENVLGIISLGVAASDIVGSLSARESAMAQVRDTFERELLVALPDCVINGALVKRLPNTSSVWLPGIRAEDLLVALDLEGILISSGAACSSGKPEPSHVLSQMGQPEARVRSTVRVSFRADQDVEVARIAASRIAQVVNRMRRAR